MRTRRRNRDFIIDLTSLLDVIFIVLFVVVVNQQNVKAANEQYEKELNEEKTEVVAQQHLYKDVMDTVGDYVSYVSVYAEYDIDNPKLRKVKVLVNQDPIKEYSLIGNDESGIDELEKFLISTIEENGEGPVILSLNDGEEEILYRDEITIENMFANLKNTYTTVYEK